MLGFIPMLDEWLIKECLSIDLFSFFNSLKTLVIFERINLD